MEIVAREQKYAITDKAESFILYFFPLIKEKILVKNKCIILSGLGIVNMTETLYYLSSKRQVFFWRSQNIYIYIKL